MRSINVLAMSGRCNTYVRYFVAVGIASGSLLGHAASTEISGDWSTYGQSTAEQRFSPLEQINERNVESLGLEWSFDLPKGARALQGTPLAIGGVVYFTTSLSIVYAVNAADGSLRWRYDPEAWRN